VQLRAGLALHSVVDTTAVIVVKAPSVDVTVSCGGTEMTDTKPDVPAGQPAPDQSDGTLLGKRYADDALGIELLCTKAGAGTLAVNGLALPLKDAKPLPASD